MLNYKVPAFWIIIVALVVCIVVAVCFLTNPPSDDTTATTNPPSTSSTDSPYGDYKLVGSSMLWSGAHDAPYIDSISCDIDGDGLTEEVRLYVGPTSGVTSYYLAVWDNKILEQIQMYSPLQGVWKFDKFADGKLYINQTVTRVNKDNVVTSEEVTQLTLNNKNGLLVLEGDVALGGYPLSAHTAVNRFASHTFDVDGDGKTEYCMIEPVNEYPYTLFRFLVFQNKDDLTPKYYQIYNYYSMYSLAFAENAEGEVVLFGMKGGAPSTAKAFDISVEPIDDFTDLAYEDGTLVLSDNGEYLIPHYTRPDDIEHTPYTYYFDHRNRVYADVDGDGKQETLTLGYIQVTASGGNFRVRHKLEWAVYVNDHSASRYIPLGIHDELGFTKDGDRVYISKAANGSAKTLGEVVCQNREFTVIMAEN